MNIPSDFITVIGNCSNDELRVLWILALGLRKTKDITLKAGRHRSTVAKTLSALMDESLVAYEISPGTEKKRRPTRLYHLNREISPRMLVEHLKDLYALRGEPVPFPPSGGSPLPPPINPVTSSQDATPPMNQPTPSKEPNPADLKAQIAHVLGDCDPNWTEELKLEWMRNVGKFLDLQNRGKSK